MLNFFFLFSSLKISDKIEEVRLHRKHPSNVNSLISIPTVIRTGSHEFEFLRFDFFLFLFSSFFLCSSLFGPDSYRESFGSSNLFSYGIS